MRFFLGNSTLTLQARTSQPQNESVHVSCVGEGEVHKAAFAYVEVKAFVREWRWLHTPWFETDSFNFHKQPKSNDRLKIFKRGTAHYYTTIISFVHMRCNNISSFMTLREFRER